MASVSSGDSLVEELLDFMGYDASSRISSWPQRIGVSIQMGPQVLVQLEEEFEQKGCVQEAQKKGIQCVSVPTQRCQDPLLLVGLPCIGDGKDLR